MDYHLIPPSPAETELIEKYREIEEQYHAAAKAAQNYFLPRVKAALKAGNVKEARRLLSICPDGVACAFIIDAFAQAGVHPQY